MYAIDTSKEFANRDEIPEELRADFDYLETHFMYKDRVILIILGSSKCQFPKCQIPTQTTDDFLSRVPKYLQKPLKFYNEEAQIPTTGQVALNDIPDVYVDSNGRFFQDAPGGRKELKFHPLCCFVKSKISAGYSSVVLKERLQERSF